MMWYVFSVFFQTILYLIFTNLNLYFMKKSFTILFLAMAISRAAVLSAQPTVNLKEYATGFPGGITDIAHSGDSRLFVTEQLGTIKIIRSEGITESRPFLDISAKVTPTNISNAGEQGLLGLVFSPEYITDGYFYVNYTNKTGIGNTVIARYKVSADPDSADVASEQILLTVTQPFANHNGGCMKFGSDGYLYIALGDGGSGGDPGNRAQNLGVLLGKMLRIDVSADTAAYSIPPTNPYFGSLTAANEIWASGLRNPWRFSFDRLTNDLWIADVGQRNWEEINYQSTSSPGGENYGWRCYEGNNIYDTTGCSLPSSYIMPVKEYSHAATSGCSVTGGFVYRDSLFMDLYGYYFFTDYCNGVIYALTTDGNATLSTAGTFAGRNFSTFGEDTTGQLYIGDQSTGTVYRIMGSGVEVKEVNADIENEIIYPNPGNGSFTYELISNKEAEVEITITDITGKECFNISEELQAGKNILPLDFKGNSGIYILKCKSLNGITRHKLTVLY